MTLLASGHLGTDFANGALPALLPFLVDRFGLTYTLAATVMLASTASSSLVQPLFGLWSDRRGAIWLLPVGVGVAGVGIALAADAPTYWSCLVLVVVSGIGVAAYHPEGSKFAAYASGRRRASGMSAFSIGGNVGFALGPSSRPRWCSPSACGAGCCSRCRASRSPARSPRRGRSSRASRPAPGQAIPPQRATTGSARWRSCSA
jgi:MFS family permease